MLFRCLTGLDSKRVCSAGAFGLDGNLLTGRTLLNLDTEDWGEICIGCAGAQLNSASFAGCTVLWTCSNVVDFHITLSAMPAAAPSK